MGTNKAFVRIGERTMVEECVAILHGCFASSLIIANQPEAFTHLGLPVFADDIPNLGPLGGIWTALRRVETEAVFVVACDMPFLNEHLIRTMTAAMGECDAVAANVAGNFEPLHTVYHRRILPVIESRIQAGELSVSRLLESVKVRAFSESDMNRFPGWNKSLQNVNTPEELENAQHPRSSKRVF